jgi:hypothetical protein
VRNTVALKTTTLLMESARRQDSWRRDHPDNGELPAPVQPAKPVVAAGTVVPALVGTAAAATELRQQIEGQASAMLGLLNRDELPEFTTTEADRCMVLLVADAAMTFATACSVATPLGPEFVERALACEQKVLALRWCAPSGACLDVMLLDQEFPGFVLNEMRSQPTAIVVAPRGGDWFALSLMAQNELAAMLEHLRPRRLIGLGDGEMEQGLSLLQQRGGVETELHCVPTPFMGWPNLRAALCDALAQWSTASVAADAAPAS